MITLYYQKLAKAVIANSDNILSAIDKYLAKADEDMEKTLRDEGFAEPKETVEQINSVQDEIADILQEQTTATAATLATAKNWKDAKKKLKRLMEDDDIAEQVEEVIADMYETEVPVLANTYIKEVESDLVVNTLRQRTSAWTSQWSKQLGELMRINTHQQLTDLIQSSIDNGESIAKLTQRIQDGGWRNEYYQAKRVALTEVLRAHSVAREEAIQQSPSTDRKEWRHTGSRHITPRQNHIDMDGQIVPANQPFTMIGKDGGIYYPQMPLDPILPAGECINCHCIHRGIANDEILGMPLEERQQLQQEIINNDDKEWEKELNEQNKAKAGIKEYNALESFSEKSREDQIKYIGGKAKMALYDAGLITDEEMLKKVKKTTLQELSENGIFTVSNSALNHSSYGEFTNSNKQYPNGRLSKGGHSFNSLEDLKQKGIKANITYQFKKWCSSWIC